MAVLERLASSLGRNDEAPNQALAEEIVLQRDSQSIGDLVASLFTASNAIKSDAIKVLYEIGERQPELIADYAKEFLQLLSSRNNRLVWGAMTALAAIANLKPDEIYQELDTVFESIEKGSVITIDNGISVLAKVGAAKSEYEVRILPFLLQHLETCKPKEVPQHSERSTVIINAKNREQFTNILQKRMKEDLTPSQQFRVKRVIKLTAAR